MFGFNSRYQDSGSAKELGNAFRVGQAANTSTILKTIVGIYAIVGIFVLIVSFVESGRVTRSSCAAFIHGSRPVCRCYGSRFGGNQ